MITIRRLTEEDAPYFAAEECAQGWHTTPDKFLGRSFAWTPFAGKGYPEIVDFAVLEKFRTRGVGSALMDEAERIAGTYADTVFLGVGLHAGYGSAQRMYAKRGYIPDGSGVWYRNRVCEPYTPCENDDDLILYLSKKLR